MLFLGPWKGDNETHCEDDNFVVSSIIVLL